MTGADVAATSVPSGPATDQAIRVVDVWREAFSTVRGDRDHGALVVDVGRRDAGAVERDVRGIGDQQVHRSVDAGAGIPPAVLVRASFDGDPVRLAEAQERVERDGERGVAVRLVGGELAVHEDDGVAVDAFELHDDGLLAPLGGHIERLRVLEHSARVVRRVDALIAVGRPRQVALRIVGKGDRQGCALGAHRLESAQLGADGPVVVERNTDHGRLSLEGLRMGIIPR